MKFKGRIGYGVDPDGNNGISFDASGFSARRYIGMFYTTIPTILSIQFLSWYEKNLQHDDEVLARKSSEFHHPRPITNHQFVFVPRRIPPPHADYSITIYLTINFTWLRLTSVIIHSDNTYFRYGHKIWCRQGTRHSYNNISSNIDPINTQQL